MGRAAPRIEEAWAELEERARRRVGQAFQPDVGREGNDEAGPSAWKGRPTGPAQFVFHSASSLANFACSARTAYAPTPITFAFTSSTFPGRATAYSNLVRSVQAAPMRPRVSRARKAT